MNSIKILCCKNTTFFHKFGSFIIQKSEGLPFCHVAILIDDFIYDAVWPRSRKIRYSDWIKSFEVVESYELELTESQAASFLSEVLCNLGVRYSMAQIVTIWLSNCVGLFEHYINTTLYNNKKAMVCTEFVARPFCVATGYRFENSFDSLDLVQVQSVIKVFGKRLK